ncbi:hypothetical protein EJB05_07283 [Eragrostis curvula]|uniref:Plantacyanin n=1 Tax=Eragrostis curvula TaxID=38414 RepID=A0A5J9WII6_9POAL|nr:hypothetical protein EJB05_07283 [Eragrostis curvula]
MAQGRGSAARGLALGGFLAVCLLLGAADVAAAATHKIDWTFNADSWSQGGNFRAGDVLVFKYDPALHNVVAVDRSDYEECRSSSGASYSSGNDHITLKAGTNYFICSLNGHCAMGMKMAVTAH